MIRRVGARRRLTWSCVALAIAAGTGVPLIAGASTSGSRPQLITPASCPEHPLALEATAVAKAATAALNAERPRDRPRILEAAVADHDGARGAMVRSACGRRTWHRTVVVFIDLRRYHPGASLSERVSFVSRTADGYRVFALGH